MTSIAQSMETDAPRSVMVDVYRQQIDAPMWHQALVAVWFLVSFVTFPGNQLLLYPLVLFFMARLVLNYRSNLVLFRKSWIIFIMPLFALASFTWSPYPSEAMRAGIFYVLSPLIFITIANDLTPRQILRAMLFACIMLTIMTLLFYSHRLPAGGPYGSKNSLGVHMAFAIMFALWAILNSKEHVAIRMVSVPVVAIGLVLVVVANSATAVVFAFLAIVGLPAMRLFWVNMAGMRHLRSVTILIFAFLALVIVNAMLNQTQYSVVNEVLGILGKDATLTGRTGLWEGARLAAAQKPWFGLGLEGFWQYDVGLAQTLNENDHKDFGTKLTFHNAFLEVRVHLGYIGWASFGAIVIWGVFHTVRAWFKEPTMERSAFLVGTIIVTVSTMSESMLWGVFNSSVSIFYLSALTALVQSRVHVGRMPLELKH